MVAGNPAADLILFLSVQFKTFQVAEAIRNWTNPKRVSINNFVLSVLDTLL